VCCPRLKALPLAHLNKKGWPWTEETSEMPVSLPDGWPKISIITPSFNQDRFIESTIRSVLLQRYPNIEYIIIDGGSSDQSVEIIKKYSKWITYWVSEPDRGQSDALNKGFDLATGDIFGWLNSDDYFAKDALRNIMKLRAENPESIAWVGACQIIDSDGNPIRLRIPKTGDIRKISNWGKDAWFSQPSCLFDARVFKETGMIDEKLDYVLDVDLWMRLSQRGTFASTDTVVSYPRKHLGMKTYKDMPSRQFEHMLIDVRYGLRDSALKKFNLYKSQVLEETPYRELVKCFVLRSQKAIQILLKKLLHEIRMFLRTL